MGEAHKNNGGGHRGNGEVRNKSYTEVEQRAVVGQLNQVDPRRWTQIEKEFLFEVNKTLSRGKKLYLNEQKLILDLYRRGVV